ncbi:MAG: hypothetical protein AABX93_00565 [Nanoarchaeota archaeon]
MPKTWKISPPPSLEEKARIAEYYNSPEVQKQMRRDAEAHQKLMDECKQNGHVSSQPASTTISRTSIRSVNYCDNCSLPYRVPTDVDEIVRIMNKPVY